MHADRPTRYAHSSKTTTFDSQYAATGPVAGGTFWKIQIADRGTVPDDTTTVVANVAVTNPTANGNLRVYPCTAEIPGASALNYTPGMTRPNELVAKLADRAPLHLDQSHHRRHRRHRRPQRHHLRPRAVGY